ncbi:hypothetical protein Droror1_Dr00023582 [Drosera rotundifolia]
MGSTPMKSGKGLSSDGGEQLSARLSKLRCFERRTTSAVLAEDRHFRTLPVPFDEEMADDRASSRQTTYGLN